MVQGSITIYGQPEQPAPDWPTAKNTRAPVRALYPNSGAPGEPAASGAGCKAICHVLIFIAAPLGAPSESCSHPAIGR